MPKEKKQPEQNEIPQAGPVFTRPAGVVVVNDAMPEGGMEGDNGSA